MNNADGSYMARPEYCKEPSIISFSIHVLSIPINILGVKSCLCYRSFAILSLKNVGVTLSDLSPADLFWDLFYLLLRDFRIIVSASDCLRLQAFLKLRWNSLPCHCLLPPLHSSKPIFYIWISSVFSTHLLGQRYSPDRPFDLSDWQLK